MSLPVSLGALRGLLREIEASSRRETWLAVGGAPELAEVLRRELLVRGGDASAVRVGAPEGATVYVHVVAGADEPALRRARRARVPIVAVVAGPAADDVSIPYVLATDVVRVAAGEGFPLEAIARALARRLGEEGAPLAARLPLLRGAVCDELVGSFARRNGAIAAAVFVPGADLPLLTLNELRLVLRLAQAHREQVGRDLLPELAAALGAGLGLRAIARELLDLVQGAEGGPGLSAGRRRLGRRRFQRIAGWAVKGAVAYAGTRALGEAAIRRFELGAPGGDASQAPTRPRA